MIAAPPEGRGWIGAALGSLAIHAAALAAFVVPAPGLPDNGGGLGPPTPIEIVALPDPGAALTPSAALLPGATLTAVTADPAVLPDRAAVGADNGPETALAPRAPAQAAPVAAGPVAGSAAGAAPASQPAAPPPLVPLVDGPALPDQAAADPGTAAAVPAEDATGIAPVDPGITHLLPEEPGLPPDPAPGTAPGASAAPAAPDPRLVELSTRIRARLTDPCLLALPMTQDGRLSLQLLSDSDRNLGALVETLTRGIDGGIEGSIGQSTRLIDQRQCAAVAYARRDPGYPVLPLGIALDHQVIESGSLLQGRLTGGIGQSLTLLLIDDTGIVQDLGPFLRRSSTEASFAVPVALAGRNRDTQQLLVALGTARRPATISALRGAPADQFFAALFAEIGQSAQVGIASFDLR